MRNKALLNLSNEDGDSIIEVGPNDEVRHLNQWRTPCSPLALRSGWIVRQ
jgi:hypothetical protein